MDNPSIYSGDPPGSTATDATRTSTVTPEKVVKKKRIRRGGKRRFRRSLLKNSDLCKTFKIFHNNIRGVDSKVESLKRICSVIEPDVVTLNETLHKSKRKVSIEGYATYGKNRKNTVGGGIATLISKSHSNSVLKVGEGSEPDEYLVTRHSQFSIPINIINVYEKVESRVTNEEIEDSWYRVVTEIKKIEHRNEAFILIGDMN